MNLAQKNTVN